MKNEFIAKVIREGIVDTNNYRYIFKDGNILRLPLSYLDTIKAIDGWEIVVSSK